MGKIYVEITGVVRLTDGLKLAEYTMVISTPEKKGSDPNLELLQAMLPSVGKMGEHVAQQVVYDSAGHWRPAPEPVPLDGQEPSGLEDLAPPDGTCEN